MQQGFCWVIGLFIVSVALGAENVSFRNIQTVPSELNLSAKGFGPELPSIGPSVEKFIRFEAPQFEELSNGRLKVLGSGTPVFGSEAPELSHLIERYQLPQGQSAEVSLEDVHWQETIQKAPLEVLSAPYVWGPQRFEIQSQSKSRFFPGRVMSSREEAGKLVVHLFPVQYDRITGNLVRVQEAKLKIRFFPKRVANVLFSGLKKTGLIVTAEPLKKAAEALQDYHREYLGVSSKIVTIEEVDKSTLPIEDTDLPDGIKSEELSDVVHVWDPKTKTGYRYELAKKLVRFLQGVMDAGEVKYIAVLGDGEVVPPSYYFSVDGGFRKKFGVTDQCYFAKKKCQEPTLAFGRLPFSSLAETENYIRKAKQWRLGYDEINNELALFGGKAFPSADVYIAELGTVNPLNAKNAGWVGVQKFYKTKGNYGRESALKLLKSQTSTRFAYYLDHGSGNIWHAENEEVTSKDILGLESTKSPSPVIVSIACSNAAFDETLAKEEVLVGGEAAGARSVGSSMLKSKAGAIAYFGGARPSIGMPVYTVDKNGNLNLSGTNYGLQLLDTLFEKYKFMQQGTVGDLVLASFKAYAKDLGNDLEDERHHWTYFNATFLGDPMLSVPRRLNGVKSLEVSTSTTTFDAFSGYGFPQLQFEPKKANALKLVSRAKAKATLYKTGGGFSSSAVVVVDRNGEGEWELPFELTDENARGRYFLRIENAEGTPVERQVWFNVTKKN